MRKWLLAGLLAIGMALGCAPGSASAHPLGNFTVNQHSRLDIEGDVIRVRYVVDMAEIPAFQERQAIDADGDGEVSQAEARSYLDRQAPALAGGLRLTIDGEEAALRVVGRELSFPPGQGGLATLRLALDLEAARPPASAPVEVAYSAANYPERPGWREIVALPGAGVALRGSTAATTSRSDELRSYPKDMLASPPDMREVRFSAAPGVGRGEAQPAPRAEPAAERQDDPLAQLIAARQLTPQAVAAALLLAFMLGAGHALAPGHGKTVVAAYLVGARGTAAHALFLGLTTTVTHTAGVFLLGFITLAISSYVLPERIYPWLELISGALVIVIGATLLRSRLRRPAGGHGHEHGHEHDHEHGPHTHTHDHEYALADWAASGGAPQGAARPGPRSAVTWRSLLALGVSGGLLPCPSALVVLLGAIALHRVAFGMLLIVAFSAGLATVLTGIGVLLVYGRGVFERLPSGGRVMRALPAASAALVTLAGCAITVAALRQTGIL